MTAGGTPSPNPVSSARSPPVPLVPAAPSPLILPPLPHFPRFRFRNPHGLLPHPPNRRLCVGPARFYRPTVSHHYLRGASEIPRRACVCSSLRVGRATPRFAPRQYFTRCTLPPWR
ncbi:uncharacterized protein CANTADRAFT_131374 [Suhomyces tanzawaensis NRRL Y-17324]|uniref:Uncharacterized protein n=1 Tax=Suhomyces tanzawaensis NRRL Y-17324 TaxID=984487 RepID=A0A1E4SRC9_9ASCO|nr:uncharacterized protein CANTADRAFT_131374 [Suhomyces tanzawaensis NRRL Y-17324]ODV81997.1 hypothetical protein CANTADRAFT_131374 [Suhomyces tanzawaensis NRRL Y-17324]